MSSNQETKRYRLILSHPKLRMVPRNWRTAVAHLTKNQLEFKLAAQFFLDQFGFSIEVEES